MKRALACVACACGSPVAPPPRAIAAPAAPDAARSAEDDALLHVVQLARARGEAMARMERPRSDLELDAFGTCVRPEPGGRAAIRDAVIAWIARTYPKETGDPAAVSIAVGCVESTGIVVDASQDREDHAGKLGRWWTLRVTDGKVTALAEFRGASTDTSGDETDETQLHTIALVDLDGDGALDVIGARTDGRTTALYAILGGREHALGRIPGAVGAVSAPSATTPVLVVVTSAGTGYYGCATATAFVRGCPASVAAERFEDELHTARIYARLQQLPDRDELDAGLAMLEVAPLDRAPLLASAKPTPPDMRAARHVAAFVQAHRLDDDAFAAEAEADASRVRASLGDAACPGGPDAKLRLERLAGAKHVDIESSCKGARGSDYEIAWEGSDTYHRALVYATRDHERILVAAIGESSYPRLDVALARHGGVAIALVVDAGEHATAYADDQEVGNADPVGGWFDTRGPRLPIAIVAGRYRHAEPGGLVDIASAATPPLDQPVHTPLEAVAQKLDAWAALEAVDASHLGLEEARVRVEAALALLGAETALVDEIRALK